MAPLRFSISGLALGLMFVAPAHAGSPPLGVLAPFVPASPSTILAFRLIAHEEARNADLPYDLVDAVMKIESDYRPEMIGGVGEIGLMQIRPATAAMMGFTGTSAGLADPAVNIHYGTTYLGQAWHLANGDVCRTLMKYRAGHGQDTMSALSATYCSRARDHLVSIGSPLASRIKPDDLVAVMTSAGTPNARPLRAGPSFWGAFRARIATANARIEAKWRRVASR